MSIVNVIDLGAEAQEIAGALGDTTIEFVDSAEHAGEGVFLYRLSNGSLMLSHGGGAVLEDFDQAAFEQDLATLGLVA